MPAWCAMRGLSELVGVIDRLEAKHGAASALLAARLIAQAALDRRESRGGHFRADHPHTAPQAEHTRMKLTRPAAMEAAE